MTTATFDPQAYEQTTRRQWQEAAPAWDRWGRWSSAGWARPPSSCSTWPASGHGSSVLDVAAGPVASRSPLRLESAAECVRFEEESFGALHQVLAGLSEQDRHAAWQEIEAELGQFETDGRFEGPCELLIAAGAR